MPKIEAVEFLAGWAIAQSGLKVFLDPFATQNRQYQYKAAA
jgi:hypothetical protein